MVDYTLVERDPHSIIDNHTVLRVQTLDYVSFVRLSCQSWMLYLQRFKREHYQNYTFPQQFVQDFRDTCSARWVDLYLVVFLAILFTWFRAQATSKIFKPWANSLGLAPLNVQKFPESAFKLCFYSCSWSYCVYVMILSGRYEMFWNPVGIWDVWYIGMPANWDIYVMYVVQCGFYLHSIYATFYMDAWRKDSYVMVLHHVLTMSLIGFSYAAGHTQEGALVLLLHDVTDIALEFTKLNMYMRRRRGKFYQLNEYLANTGFILFAATWALFRLYWYPLKVLYCALYGALHIADQSAPFIPFFNLMLYMLLALNIYWFHFIILLLVRIFTGQEVDDTREYEDAEHQYQQYNNATVSDPTLNANVIQPANANGVAANGDNDKGDSIRKRLPQP